ncbi:uncharacterized protein VTP21DRAFT_93 [Calcarisporiella thermophila]|uniref:uncharacterized protein n=1 Tax=Calcarisporiella thermophila TaxID=911321 RepID=UPI00374417C4
MSITLLPARVQLLSVPTSDLPLLVRSIIKHVFPHHFGSSCSGSSPDAFFSYTDTGTEVSIIAEVEAMQADFAPLVGRVAARITEDVFRVLQVEDTSGIEASGSRIDDLSRILSQAAITMVYTSTHQSDFILVKESRVDFVLQTLNQSGFSISNTPPYFHEQTRASASLASSPGSFDYSDRLMHPNPPEPDDQRELVSRSMTLRALNCRLRQVGLNHEYVDECALKLIKIMFYPQEGLDATREQDRFFSFTSSIEGISLLLDERHLSEFEPHMLQSLVIPITLRCIQLVFAENYYLDKYGVVYSVSHPLVASGINLLYVSTYCSANVVVEEEDMDRTLALLSDVVPASD